MPKMSVVTGGAPRIPAVGSKHSAVPSSNRSPRSLSRALHTAGICTSALQGGPRFPGGARRVLSSSTHSRHVASAVRPTSTPSNRALPAPRRVLCRSAPSTPPPPAEDRLPEVPKAKGAVVTVFGATGRIGRVTVERLLALGASVRGVVRDAEKANGVLPVDNERLDICVCDITNHKDVRTVLKGCVAAIWCVSLEEAPPSIPSPFSFLKDMLPFGSTPKSKETALDIIIDELQSFDQGTCIVMLSSAAVTRPAWSKEKKERLELVVDIPIVRLNPFHALDKQRKQEKRLRNSGVPYSIVRPVGLKSDAEWAPGRPLISQGDVAVGRANYRDVADTMISAAFAYEAHGKTFEMITLQGYMPPTDGLKSVFSRLVSDSQRSEHGEDLGFGEAPADSPGELWVDAQYHIMMQLLPGQIQDPTRLEMGRKYEEVDANIVNRAKGAAPTQREKQLANGFRRN